MNGELGELRSMHRIEAVHLAALALALGPTTTHVASMASGPASATPARALERRAHPVAG